MKRWVSTEPSTVARILSAMDIGDDAIVEGRVFVDRRRVKRGDEPVGVRSEVVVHDRREGVALPERFVLHDAAGVLAVDKPAGIATVPDVEGSAGTLIDLAARATSRSVVDLHPTSRLDRDVSGVVTFAIGEAAREALARAREAKAYVRRYVAIVRGDLPDRAVWDWSIARHRNPRLRRAVAPKTHDAKPAATRMRVVARSGEHALVALAPETGRTHQIRVHAQAAGAPIVGDRSYGGAFRLTFAGGRVRTVGRVALHCARVEIALPDCMIRVSSPVPRELVELATELGLGGFEEAIECGV